MYRRRGSLGRGGGWLECGISEEKYGKRGTYDIVPRRVLREEIALRRPSGLNHETTVWMKDLLRVRYQDLGRGVSKVCAAYKDTYP